MEILDAYRECYLIYNRKSTDDADNQRNSLVYQRERNLDYAEREECTIASDLTIAGFCANGIIDESHSGFKEEDEFEIKPDGMVQYRTLRPKFVKLAESLKQGKVRGVIFLCWDRASRNAQDDLLLKKLIRIGSDIRFVEAQYEKTSAGDLHRDIDGVFAAHFSRNISEKVRNAQRKLWAERRCIYASPIGYLDKGSADKPLDPTRAPIVKRIFELYATGDWSIRELAKWARAQGLTKKPTRRKRTQAEIANNVDVASIPKIARTVDHKTIEYMLPNPFYIGKIKIGDDYVDSAAHQPLIDRSLFHQVQQMLRQKRVSVYYLDKPFYTYRALLRCSCGRGYSPYMQKGIIYYRSRCKEGCSNADPNLKESDVTDWIQKIIDRIRFSDDELAEIESRAKTELAKLSQARDNKLNDLHDRQRNVMQDIDYIVQNRISLLRTGAMSLDTMQGEQGRLEAKLANINEEITIFAESAPEMLKYVLTFSELVRNASLYFTHALDSEKRDIAMIVFTELVFRDRRVVDYKTKDGFAALLQRTSAAGACEPSSDPEKQAINVATGSPVYPFSELHTIYPLVRASMEKMRALPFLCRSVQV
jgi:site-specific DNA recombinase